MSDDREEFERDRLAEDEEDDTVVTRTLLHRQTYPIPDEGLNEIPAGATHYAYRRFMDGPAIDFWREEPDSAPPGPRFGDRLRKRVGEWIMSFQEQEALAAEIDADRDHLQAGLDSWKESAETWYAKAVRRVEPEDLRQRIEEAVESLAYPELPDGEGDGRQVIWEAKLLAALAEIFGEGPAEPSARILGEILTAHAQPAGDR